MTTCHIAFENNPMKIVYSGQSIRGSVQINLKEEINLRGIYIHLYGGAYTCWRSRLQFFKTHTGNEDFLNQRIWLVGATNGHIRLMPGIYNYTFACKLQAALLTSFEGQHGYIRYTALVVIDHQHLKEKTFYEPFTVIRNFNLNYNPELRNRIIVEKQEMYRRSWALFCWCPDPIKLITRTSVTAYTPGQVINMDIIVDNQSALSIANFTAMLIREVTYTKSSISNDRRIERTTINKQIGDGCDRYKSKIILLNIEVPSTPPSDASGNLIKIEYYVHIIGSMPRYRANIRINFPVIIGTFPLRDNITTQLNQMINENQSHSSRNGISTSHENDEPSIYEETVQLRAKSADTYFKPKYAVFNHATAYSRRN